jgi:GT2 family glycosyltransferase
VVVPTRNRLRLLREAVASVQAQQFEDWELIVVDDASDDGTAEWVASLDDARVRGIRLDEHSERSAARNTGLRDARGVSVLFLDDDDRLRPGSLLALWSALDRVNEAVAAVGAVEGFDERGHRRRFRHPRRTRVRDVFDDVMFGWVGLPAATLFRTRAISDAGGWNEDLTQGEDQELALRLAVVGPSVLVPATVVEQRLHTGQRRPPDTFEIENAAREAFLASAPARTRDRGAAVLSARRRVRLGVEDWVGRRPRRALRHFTAAVAARPSLALSPLVGRRIRSLWARCAIGSVVGGRVLMVAYRAVWWVRRRAGRAPYSTASAVPDVTGMPLAEHDGTDGTP